MIIGFLAISCKSFGQNKIYTISEEAMQDVLRTYRQRDAFRDTVKFQDYKIRVLTNTVDSVTVTLHDVMEDYKVIERENEILVSVSDELKKDVARLSSKVKKQEAIILNQRANQTKLTQDLIRKRIKADPNTVVQKRALRNVVIGGITLSVILVGTVFLIDKIN
jgi:hypothetical protein